MKINYSKTKEMLCGPLSKLSIPHLVINYNSVERVCGFKLLGVYISNDLSWNLHVDYICARPNARLHYLKRLKRAGLPTDRLATVFGISPSLDQFLNTAHLFASTA